MAHYVAWWKRAASLHCRQRGEVAMADTKPPAESPRNHDWLVLVYRVQSEPSRLRASVWRRLKSIGAIYLQAGTAAMPWDAAGERAMRILRRDIARMSGSSILLRCEALAGEAEAVDAFNAARADEYGEITRKCEDFLQQLEREKVAEHYTFAELEENEVDLVKLQKWLAKVSARDLLGAPGRQAAEQLLHQCEEALERYADRVYFLDADVN
jgi:hypothetical protein